MYAVGVENPFLLYRRIIPGIKAHDHCDDNQDNRNSYHLSLLSKLLVNRSNEAFFASATATVSNACRAA